MPVFGARRDVVAALGISGPTPRLQGRLDELGHHLLDESTALSALLGAPAQPHRTARRSPRTEEVVA